MVTRGRVRRDAFVDSVALMQVTERVRALPGVRAAALVMATELNRRVLDETDLLPAEVKRAGPTDLVIVVRAESADAADAALGQAEAFLAARRGDEGPHRREPPRSITGAARRLPGANVALVSVPGAHAAAEAHQALSAGLHVFLFSDGVSLADEIALKQRAAARGLLVMGPECGTSLVNGVGFGFANRVRRGHVGLVAASGTGLQEVSSLIHRLGGGSLAGHRHGRTGSPRGGGRARDAPDAVLAGARSGDACDRARLEGAVPRRRRASPGGRRHVPEACRCLPARLAGDTATRRRHGGHARGRGARMRPGARPPAARLRPAARGPLAGRPGARPLHGGHAVRRGAGHRRGRGGEVRRLRRGGVHAGAPASDHRSEPPKRGHRPRREAIATSASSCST